tara:strand:- start:549 stop:770 length:222 start_codon:yes stop_codon:yes gene_type:complete
MKKRPRDIVKLFIDIILWKNYKISQWGIDVFLISLLRLSLEFEKNSKWYCIKISLAFWKLSGTFQFILEKPYR